MSLIDEERSLGIAVREADFERSISRSSRSSCQTTSAGSTTTATRSTCGLGPRSPSTSSVSGSASSTRERAERQRLGEFRGLRTQAQFERGRVRAGSRESSGKVPRFGSESPGGLRPGSRGGRGDWALAAAAGGPASPAEQNRDHRRLLRPAADPLPGGRSAAGLKILDRAARLRPEPTAAYHLRRADCLAGPETSPAGTARKSWPAGDRRSPHWTTS